MTTPSVGPLANYDNAWIAVTPEAVNNAVNAISSEADNISNNLDLIFTTLSNLKISWVGQASDASTELIANWTANLAAVFGSGNGPVNTGSMNMLLSYLGQVASAYASTEQAISGMFTSLYNQLVAPAPLWGGSQSSQPSSTITPVTDSGTDAPYYLTSVNET